MPRDDASTSSRKRARKQEEVVEDDATDVDTSRHLAIQSARSAKKYLEAIDIRTEALKEEHLSRLSRTQLLITRCAIYSEMEGHSSEAYQDADEAVSLSPEDAKVSVENGSGLRRGSDHTSPQVCLLAANAPHKGFFNEKAIRALSKAAMLATYTMADLDWHIKHLNPPLIDILPIEILAHVFGFLSIKDIVACTRVCRRWKQVTSSNSKIWRQPVILRGPVKKVDAKWKAFCKVSGGGQISSLTLDLSQNWDTDQDIVKL